MPNYCENKLTIYNSDYENIKRLFVNDVFSFNSLVPETIQDENDGWYQWRIDSWGTKWDALGPTINLSDINEGIESIVIGFDTAWSPPEAFYDAMTKEGFDFEAIYYEPGMEFLGKYGSGVYEYPSGFYSESLDIHVVHMDKSEEESIDIMSEFIDYISYEEWLIQINSYQDSRKEISEYEKSIYLNNN